jgi:predicted amidohydrolase YtcJ
VLVPGRLADFVVLSKDILAIPPGEIPSAAVEVTVVGGRIVHGPEGSPITARP